MTTVNGLTAERMLEIEANSIVDGDVVGDNLILRTRGGTPIDAGSVRGFPGISDMAIYDPVGVPKPLLIPTVPGGYGVCNASTEYDGATYPILAGVFLTGAACVNGACAPGKFRLPDMRGQTLVGLHPGVTAFNALLKTGGSKDSIVVVHDHVATSDQAPHNHPGSQVAHNHFGATNWGGAHGHGVGGDDPASDRIVITWDGSSITMAGGAGAQEVTYTHLDPAPDHQHVIANDTPAITIGNTDPTITTTVNNRGVSGTDANLPPYRVVNWIMRLA